MENTTYLHNHSVYSLFDGAQIIKEMVERAKELGCKNLALTDHGTMIGIPKFVAECKKNDIKPLIGVEIYMQNPDDIIENMNIVNKGHSCLYAVNNEGYTQLCHILSDSEKNLYTAISTGAVYILTGRYEIKDGKSSFIINDINESLTNGEDFLVHVDSWKEWNTKYYPEAIKKSSINGSTLYVHNRKSGQIIRFSKKIKNFSNFKEAKYAFIHK